VLTVAEFVICPVVPGAVTEMTTVAVSNAASVPRLHVIVAPGGRQLPKRVGDVDGGRGV
jgi:hypothetical protein